jgi:hypothetical protein
VRNNEKRASHYRQRNVNFLVVRDVIQSKDKLQAAATYGRFCVKKLESYTGIFSIFLSLGSSP